MAPLSTELRNRLERTITEARDVAEAGACAALEGIAVHHFEPYKHQSVEQRKLRNHLRARARQLGDIQTAKGELQINHLVHELAYEHWHRMLFARFLAENNLLIEPSHGVAISLQECEELAKAANTDLWTYASRCAQQMLPQIFRPDDPLLQITLAREHQVKLERLLAALDPATFKADDSLGWVYQFWQSKKKKEVNESGQKITGDTLPAVTQLFTEHYMVLFLLHNTIGAWYAGKVLAANPKLAKSAASEDELRKAVALTALGGYSFDYLRFVRDDENSSWRPAAGTFDGWPKTAGEVKVLDPCCGSGHFLVAVFDLLIRLRMQKENLSVNDAIDAVLKDNIFGLEIDARCTQIAAFNLALAAWKLTVFRPLPGVHIACCGIGPQSTQDQWLKLLEQTRKPIPALARQPIREGLLNLHSLFSRASTLGSLIDPSQLPKDLIAADYETLQPYLAEILSTENTDDEIHERAVAAAGMVKAIDLLAEEYTLVITNVPYLGRGDQCSELRDYCSKYYGAAKNDIANVFLERSLGFCGNHGTTAVVMPQNWLSQARYEAQRRDLLDKRTFHLLTRLGEGGFDSPQAAGAYVILFVISCMKSHSPSISGCEIPEPRNPIGKAEKLRQEQLTCIPQKAQLENPNAIIKFELSKAQSLLGDYATCIEGLSTGDSARFIAKFWELDTFTTDWAPLIQNVIDPEYYAGREDFVFWQEGKGDLHNFESAHNFPSEHMSGFKVLGNYGIRITQMREARCTIYTGEIFGKSGGTLVANNIQLLPAIWCYCNSKQFNEHVQKANPAVYKPVGTYLKVPFDIAYWQKIADEKYPNGLPKPFSNDPTQWLFNGNPNSCDQSIHVAIARMVGYQWPRQSGTSFLDCPAIEPDRLHEFADDDGIICIPAVRGEEPASERLLAMLAACGIKPDIDLDDWLRNSFFEEHCKLFHHRPFIWHIWDGRRRDGFHALINYHKLAEGNCQGKKLLESLTYSYLGEWISRQQDGVRRGEGGAEDRLAAATELQKQLIAIIEGQPPYDIFVRWKPLHKQPIGWEPDINDGVRINIRPFLINNLSNGRSGAGILRWKPNIKWEKDRGNEPQRPKNEYPWFWGWDGNTTDFTGGPEFKGERFNACHYTLQAKQQAREAARKDE